MKRGVIAEVGSRDALDRIGLAKRLDEKTYVFEPEPINKQVCKKNIETMGLD